jgi:hypothetical protein
MTNKPVGKQVSRTVIVAMTFGTDGRNGLVRESMDVHLLLQ